MTKDDNKPEVSAYAGFRGYVTKYLPVRCCRRFFRETRNNQQLVTVAILRGLYITRFRGVKLLVGYSWLLLAFIRLLMMYGGITNTSTAVLKKQLIASPGVSTIGSP